eukprot:TRINITY_DN78804_c0_g1_i1.p1 TRINITY_DN78804_c0_g1~~TRINITY_DN78804_c0_g1_i1.p1  ORF type:complete len:252 (-),score=50.49 TRINITY_DN78804_c0_g1_i1:110-766(-)
MAASVSCNANVTLGKEHHLARVLASSVTQCRLCREAPIHRCVTAVPCGHNFDLGCLLAWRTHSDKCPCCNQEVKQAVRNRVVDGMTQTFLRSHPEAARNASTLRLLEAAERSAEGEEASVDLLLGDRSRLTARAKSQAKSNLWRSRPSSARAKPTSEEPTPEVEQLPKHLKHLQPFVAAAAAMEEGNERNSEAASEPAPSTERTAATSPHPSNVCTIC